MKHGEPHQTVPRLVTSTLLVLAVARASAAATTGSDSPSLQLEVVARQTDSITIRWNMTDTNSTVSEYRVNANDDSGAYHVTYGGEALVDGKRREATINLHESNKSYNICVIAVLGSDSGDEGGSAVECVQTSTIKTMLTSSIVALTCVLGFFLLCVVVGYVSWKCAVRGSKAADERQPADDYMTEKSDVNGNGDIVPLTQMEE